MKDNNNATIIAMLEELLTVSKNQRAEQTVNADVDLTPIKELIQNGNRENKEYYEAKSTKFAGAVINELSKIHKRMDAFEGQEQPDIEGVKQLLTEATDKMDEIKVKHHIHENRHSFVLHTKKDWALLIMVVIILSSAMSAIYHLSRPNVQQEDNDLKYRYIKMKGEATPKQIVELENIFELNRDNAKIKQMREDVKAYEDAVKKQAALAEQARLKEQAAKELDNKAKSIKGKPIQTDKQKK